MSLLKSMRKSFTDEELTDRLCVIVGTRPGIIKQAPVIEALKELQGFLLLKRSSPEEPYRLLEKCPLPPKLHHVLQGLRPMSSPGLRGWS